MFAMLNHGGGGGGMDKVRGNGDEADGGMGRGSIHGNPCLIN